MAGLTLSLLVEQTFQNGFFVIEVAIGAVEREGRIFHSQYNYSNASSLQNATDNCMCSTTL